MRQRNYINKLRDFNQIFRSQCPTCYNTEDVDINCSCYKRLVKTGTLLKAGIPEKYWDLELDTLKKGIAPAAIKAVSSYIANLDENLRTGRGAYIWSDKAQSGKSTLGYIIMKAALRQGKKAFQVSLSDCASAFDRRAHNAEEADFLYDNLLDSDLVVVDNVGDLNTLVTTPSFHKSSLQQIYTTRANNNKATILTSNLPIAKIEAAFGLPFQDAIQNSAYIIQIPKE